MPLPFNEPGPKLTICLSARVPQNAQRFFTMRNLRSAGGQGHSSVRRSQPACSEARLSARVSFMRLYRRAVGASNDLGDLSSRKSWSHSASARGIDPSVDDHRGGDIAAGAAHMQGCAARTTPSHHPSPQPRQHAALHMGGPGRTHIVELHILGGNVRRRGRNPAGLVILVVPANFGNSCAT